MRVSKFYLSTLKETPAEAEIASHKLLLRAGLIRKLTGGLYTFLPLGLRALRKVEQIVREEMDRAGALEAAHARAPAARHLAAKRPLTRSAPQRALQGQGPRTTATSVLGPTHEEVITDTRAPRDQLLPAAAEELLPDPDQVPRRDPPALRPDARQGVHHEGRLLASTHDEAAQAAATRRCTTPTRASSRAAASSSAPVEADTGVIGGKFRTSSWCRPRRARTRSSTATAATTRPTSRRPRRSRRPPRARRAGEAMARVPTPGQVDVRGGRASCSACRLRAPSSA